MNKINITIEKEDNLQLILDEIQQLKREINKKDSEIKILELEKKHYREIIEMIILAHQLIPILLPIIKLSL